MKILALVTVALLASSAPAQASPQDDANWISEHVMSPFCPGVTLHDCPSDSAVALRDRITAMAAQGFTRAQIMAELEREYGAGIRAEPMKSGSGLLAWLLPVLGAIAGGSVALMLARRWLKVPEPPDGYDPDVHMTELDRRRLDAELDKFRGPA
jgi:cytochrome c-type biogenesis protein CcmH/NrfF